MSLPNRKLRAIAEAYGRYNETVARRHRAVARAAVVEAGELNASLAAWRARIQRVHAPMESRDSMPS